MRRPALRTRPGGSERYRRRGVVAATLALAAAGTCCAPGASADSGDLLSSAVIAARPASCPPLKANPLVREAAAGINRSNDLWLDYAARAEPETDPMPRLKDLGYQGSKAVIIHGAAKNEADSIKALLLQGYAAIPDCTYTDFGVDVSQSNSDGWILTALVLAG
ncbi:hypothetical protein ORI20_09900 [Mycobacterium sp. CVI_P3]|uniref:CAP domain-containing protein n=1 Tax=Mycobacterium pinniadriaticum TaxID=2994102 RepID=A0ABT3SBZ4_9MYCO|nr:hypothetical protein [Mycobacterium pinniadriaticum]MCX2930589.1 hypothetical protein [Mycobacterium pinniadriaticum]MCX2937013.1 hypothetical protein [Mycobacterium pinniadriaticum]